MKYIVEYSDLYKEWTIRTCSKGSSTYFAGFGTHKLAEKRAKRVCSLLNIARKIQ